MTVSEKSIGQSIQAFILEELVSDPDITNLTEHESLLEGSMVDSLGIMRLIAFIESEFCFVVPGDDVTVDNFETINAIVGYLHPRLKENED